MSSKYAELVPQRVSELLENGAPVIWPWGALEWHGDHLPLGLDGIVAENFGEQLAERVGGVLLPTCWLPITTLPHRFSLQITTATLRRILDESLAGLATAGATRIAIVTGHYAQGHEMEMYEAALRAMEDISGLRVYCAAPLELLGDCMLDHAGRIETSQLLHLRPDLVQVDVLPPEVTPKAHAVLGAHPGQGSSQEGRELTEAALELWKEWLDSDRPSLHAHYGQAFDRYQSYVDQFGEGSWEQAIVAWWATKS